MSNHKLLLTVNKELEKRVVAYFKYSPRIHMRELRKSPYSRSDSENFRQCRNELEI